MRLLFDTHTFLWFIDSNPRLSFHARHLIEDTRNDRLLSIASLWEMAIKTAIGKLQLNLTFLDLVRHHVEGNAMKSKTTGRAGGLKYMNRSKRLKPGTT